MKFEEALNALHTGEYVARTAWDGENKFCVIMPGMDFIWQILCLATPNAGVWMASVADLGAEDWKIISRTELPVAPEAPKAEDTQESVAA